MNWINLEQENQLQHIKEDSYKRPIVIFKHSTRCSISIMAKARLERSEAPLNTDFYYLDLLQYRPLSNLVAEAFLVPHESPQLLLIRNGDCCYEESHNGIQMDDLRAQIS